MTMIKRKVMALGRSSLVISLPREWLKRTNIDRGDEVTVTMEDDLSLTVSPGRVHEDKENDIELSIRSDESEDSIIRKTIGCYMNGYHVIRLRSATIFSVEQQKAIRNVMSTLYMRIIEATSSSTVLQTLMDESLASVTSGIERMYIITSSMCQDLLKAMREWDEELAKSVISLEDDIDQFSYFLLRLLRSAAVDPSLAKRLDLNMLDCLDYQTLIKRIEHIADQITSIAENLINLYQTRLFFPREVFNVIIDSTDMAFHSYERSVQSFLEHDVEVTHGIIDMQEEIERMEETITPLPYYGDRHEKDILCHICIIRDSIKRVSEYAADIAELTIDSSYRR